MTRGWWLSRLPGALGRTRRGFARAALTMMLFGAATLTAAAPEGPKAGAGNPAPAAPAPAAPTPAGFNPELPASVNKALDTIAAHSLLGALLVISLFVNAIQGWLMWKRKDVMDAALKARDSAHAEALRGRDQTLERERTEWATDLSQLQEARLALLERVMTVCGNATAVIQMHAASNSERSQSTEKLAETLRDFIVQATVARGNFLSIAEDIQRHVRSNSDRLSRVTGTGGPSL